MLSEGRGNLIVVTAPPGAGKSTLVEYVVSHVDGLRYSISYTTREPRGKELHGRDYFFVSLEEFRRMRSRGEFIESAEVHGNLYGTARAAIDAARKEGQDIILDIDVQGARQICAVIPDAITVFVLPPSFQELEQRLRQRNTDGRYDIERRLRNASVEVQSYREFQYLIINDNLERACSALAAIILAERHRVNRLSAVAEKIISSF